MTRPPQLIPATMSAVLLTGHGGLDKLVYATDVPVPSPAPNEVLIRVHAAGINNTDINTRIGWYAPEATGSTDAVLATGEGTEKGDWTGGGLQFPRIQGADLCGEIVAMGEAVSPTRLGERVIVQSCLRSLTQGSFTPWLGSERDGAFAQYTTAPSADTYAVDSSLDDTALAALPCAFGTAENLLARAGVTGAETVLITGASGNVGLAAIQLARLRGANVIAQAARDKAAALTAVGAERCITRDADLVAELGAASIDVVIDVVGGPQWSSLLDVLRVRGRYAVSGAIAGPIVPLDLRKLYLKDLTFVGCTTQDAEVFPALVRYIERGAIQPLIARTYPLAQIAEAQTAFLEKREIGKFVLLPRG
jgi:NADPH:quinone reductase-like Zn-dependent oxidoreductase